MFMKTSFVLSIVIVLLVVSRSHAQGNTEYTGGYKVKLNEDGSKYFRTIMWGQFWAEYSDQAPEQASKTNISVRRARILTYAQLNEKFLILTHFGYNSANGDNLSPTGKGASSQLFFHDFWGEWKITDGLSIGAGQHYWNGISRLTGGSTLNFLTLDNNRQSWATLGLSDQFARHIGIYLKGNLGKLQFRVSLDEAIADNLQAGVQPEAGGPAVYQGRALLGSAEAGKVFQGYADFHFFEEESDFLPYRVGTYLGTKKVFNVGAGFLLHPNGTVLLDGDGALQGEDVGIFAVDAFLDMPLFGDGSAITAYAVFQSQDYGRDFELGQTYATGSMFYTHLGYLIPGRPEQARLQPYASVQYRTIEARDDHATRLGIGGNLFLTGHHSKLTVEYSHSNYAGGGGNGQLTVQAMIYL